MFTKVDTVPAWMWETEEHLRAVPGKDLPWVQFPEGTRWGAPWGTAWFRGEWVVPSDFNGKRLFLRAETDGVETMLWVDGVPRGIFTHARDSAGLGNHHTLLIAQQAVAGRKIEFALEAYAGHPCVGTQPFDVSLAPERYPNNYERYFRGMHIMERDDAVVDFVFDLSALLKLFRALPETSFRRGHLAGVLEKVFSVVALNPASKAGWREGLAAARELMRDALARPAESSAPTAGLVGHSHLDSAWLWTLDETIRKAARTYSNVLSLMDQYPEFTFIQSTPYHADLMRRHYPAVWQGIVRRVQDGRWEPNGGMWIECDCNLTGGEAMVRQFLKGIGFTREHFSYTPDTFWLPDTFGYNGAIPQIMRGCGLKYFLTTKLTWNEVNTFPFDTFWWQGVDGSRVLVHFNETHCTPDPGTLIGKLNGGGQKDFRTVQNFVLHKDVNDRRLISYGFGDGGGGPEFEMIESARRCEDLEGCPRASHTTASAFMKELETRLERAPVHYGELYVEGHRGSLTSMAQIKRGNRKAELALRDAEILSVLGGTAPLSAAHESLEPLWDILLVNQFHDILPGTSLPEVHDRAVAELTSVISRADKLAIEWTGEQQGGSVTFWNTLSWDRRETVWLPRAGGEELKAPPGSPWQLINRLDGSEGILFEASVPALGSRRYELLPVGKEPPAGGVVFSFDGEILETPMLRMVFGASGEIISLRMREGGWEVCRSGGALNLFLCGEDVPEAWDAWNIDADHHLKLLPQRELLERFVVSSGPLQFRLRSRYRIGEESQLIQDLIVHADSARVDFESRLDWKERHALLKVAFETTLRASHARHEIPFGHIERPIHRNNSYELPKFEVGQHKWSAISETRRGVALLNDCKYGLSTGEGAMRLTLAKGGLHPDPRGDRGGHDFTYTFLPYNGPFTAPAVIRPGYELNLPLRAGGGEERESLLQVLSAQLVLEAMKPAEDGRGFIVRLYEAEGSSGEAEIFFTGPVGEVCLVNLLEEKQETLGLIGRSIRVQFSPFQIISLRVLPV